MKTYKGLLCSLLATRMLLGQETQLIETPTIQTQPPGSEESAAAEALMEREKQLLANAMSGTPTETPESKQNTPVTSQPESVIPADFIGDATSESEVDSIEMSADQETIETVDSSSFASAQKLFNEMWGTKPEKVEKKKSTPATPKVIPTKESNPSTSSAQISSTLPPNDLIPFNQTKTYAPNPVAGSDVKLPPMPDTLLPMGKPKLVAVTAKPKPKLEPVVNSEKTPEDSSKHSKNEAKEENAPQEVATPSHSPSNLSLNPTQIAVSPFIQWIRENDKSPEIAKEVHDQYKSNETRKDSTNANDVFIKVRFPYTGSQSTPPVGGAVIYSTPQK